MSLLTLLRPAGTGAAGSAALLAHTTTDPDTAGTLGPYVATYATACTGLTTQLALLAATTTPPAPAPPPAPVAGPVGVPPLVQVLAALGNPTVIDPQAGALILGVGPPLDTGTLGGVAWVDISSDVQQVTIRRGRAGELEAATPGGIDITLDNTRGDYDPTNPLSPYTTLLDVGFAVWVRAIWGGTYDLGYAYCDDITLDIGYEPTATFHCIDGLEVLGRAGLPEQAPAFDSDLSGVRIGRILDAAGWPSSLRHIDTGQSQLAATTYGNNALPLIQEVLDTEVGAAFIAADGSFVFYDRYHQATSARATTVQANFTDTAGQAEGSTEVEMQSLQVSLGRDMVFNHAVVTPADGTEQVALNAASKDRYGQRTIPGSPGVLLRTDAEALNLAQWLVNRYATPKVRATELVVDATTQDLWGVLMPLQPLDRVRVTRDYGANTITSELHIQGMTLSIDVTGGQVQALWTWTFQTSSPTLVAPIVLDVGPPIGVGELGF